MSFDSAMSSSQVQLLKSRFEKLNRNESKSIVDSLDITPIRAKSGTQNKFVRSATCIDFTKLRLNEVSKEPIKEKDEPGKFQFQRQLSNSSNSSYKSIRRSPAFRFDAQSRPVVKSVTKEKDDPVRKKIEIDELEYLETSATIKKALSKPLPKGSPPKKPPRTFLSPEFTKKKEASPEPFKSLIHKLKISPNTLPKKATKTEEKKAISSFLNCIISPCSIDPIYYEQIKKERSRQYDTEESIYMEPYAHLKKDFVNNNINRSPKPNEELHYMCTVLDPQPTDSNGNTSKNDQKDLKRSSLETSDIEDYEKVKIKDIKTMLRLE